MPSQLGKTIRARREELKLSIRGLAREISKSPSLIVELERSATPPSVSEETLRSIGWALQIDADLLVVLAGKTPDDVVPESLQDVELYRMIRGLPDEEKDQLKEYLRRRGGA